MDEKKQIDNQSAKSEVDSLVRLARKNDRAAFDRLVEMFSDRIFRMVYYRTHSRMDAEDLTQEVFIRVVTNINGLKDESRFTPWLFSIAANTVRDFHRKRKLLWIFKFRQMQEAGENSVPGAQTPDPLDNVLKQEFWGQVEIFSKNLSYWEREIFFLRFFDQLGIREIAQATNKSESAVKTHLYRALAKFKKKSGAFARFREESQ